MPPVVDGFTPAGDVGVEAGDADAPDVVAVEPAREAAPEGDVGVGIGFVAAPDGGVGVGAGLVAGPDGGVVEAGLAAEPAGVAGPVGPVGPAGAPRPPLDPVEAPVSLGEAGRCGVPVEP